MRVTKRQKKQCSQNGQVISFNSEVSVSGVIQSTPHLGTGRHRSERISPIFGRVLESHSGARMYEMRHFCKADMREKCIIITVIYTTG